MSETVVRRVRIRGRVQGVGFRAFVEYTAQDHGLAGWVRNRRDGSVEAVFAGGAGGGRRDDRGLPARAAGLACGCGGGKRSGA